MASIASEAAQGGSVIQQLAAEAGSVRGEMHKQQQQQQEQQQEEPGVRCEADADAAIDVRLEKGHVRRMAASVTGVAPSPAPAAAAAAPPLPPPPPLLPAPARTVTTVLGSLQGSDAVLDPHAFRQVALMRDIQKQRASGESRAFVEPPTNSRNAMLLEIKKRQRMGGRAVAEPTINDRGTMLIEMQKAARDRSPWIDAELQRERSVQELRIQFDDSNKKAGLASPTEPGYTSHHAPEPEPEPEPEPAQMQPAQMQPATFIARFEHHGQLGLNYGSSWPYVESIKPGSLGAQIRELTEGCKLVAINGRTVNGKELADTKLMVKARPVELTFEKSHKVDTDSPNKTSSQVRVSHRGSELLHDRRATVGTVSHAHSVAKRATQAATMAAERAAAEEAHIRQASLFRARPVPAAVHSPRIDSSPRAAAATQNFVQRQQAAASERERAPTSRSLFARSRRKAGHSKQRQANAALVHPASATGATGNCLSAHELTRATGANSDVALHLSGDVRRRRTTTAILHSLQQAMRAQNRSVFGFTIEDPAHVFAAFDRDGSGRLSPDELKNAMRRLGLGLSEQQLSELVESIDEDGDGEVDYAELLDFLVGEHETTSVGSNAMIHPESTTDENDEVEGTEQFAKNEATTAISAAVIHPETTADDPDDDEMAGSDQHVETMEEKEEHYKALLAAQKVQVEQASQALAAEQAARRAAEAEVLQAEQAAKARFDALLVADMKAALENALKAELAARQGQSADSAIERYVASLAGSSNPIVEALTGEQLRHDAATRIQSFYRGRRAREEVYRFLLEKEKRRRQNWEEQWKQAQQMRKRAEQLFQEGEEKLAQARKFAASAEQDRVASTDDDASLQKWLASRSHPESSMRQSHCGVSFLHNSYEDGRAAGLAKKAKATASSANLSRLSQTHLEKAEKIRKAKVDRDRRRAQEEAEQCIDWKIKQLFESVDSTKCGTLHMTGIGILCTQLGLAMDEASIARAVAKMDGDKDGRVTLLEFNTWFTKASKARARRSDTRTPHAPLNAGHVQQTIQKSRSPGDMAAHPSRSQLPVGDRLHAWSEKRRDDRIAKQSSWMEDGARAKSRQPHINPKSRRLAEPRTREHFLDRFDTWQRTKEEKIAQKVKQQEVDEVKDLQDKPDISSGLSKRVQLQMTGDVADRLSTGLQRPHVGFFEELSKPKQSSNTVAEYDQDVHWAKTEPVPKIEHRFASTSRDKFVTDPTKETRSSIARKTTLGHTRTSVDGGTFGEVYLQHSISMRKQSPSPPRKNASGTAMPTSPTASREHSARVVGARLHQQKKRPEPEELSFSPELMFEGRAIPRELVHVAERKGPVHERLFNAASKQTDRARGSANEHDSPKQSSPPLRRSVPTAASAPTWSHIMKMQTVPVDGGRKPRGHRTALEKKKANGTSSRPSPNTSTRPPHANSGRIPAVEGAGGFNVPAPANIARPEPTHDAVLAHVQASLAQARAEEQAAAREVVAALKTAAACQAAEVEARAHEIQTMQQLELERTGKAPRVPNGSGFTRDEDQTSSDNETDDPLADHAGKGKVATASESQQTIEPELVPEPEEEEARTPGLFHVAAEKALEDALATVTSDDGDGPDSQIGRNSQDTPTMTTHSFKEEGEARVLETLRKIETPQTKEFVELAAATGETDDDENVPAADSDEDEVISGDTRGRAPVFNPLDAQYSESDTSNDDDEENMPAAGSDEGGVVSGDTRGRAPAVNPLDSENSESDSSEQENEEQAAEADEPDPFAELENQFASGNVRSDGESEDDVDQEQRDESDAFGALEALMN